VKRRSFFLRKRTMLRLIADIKAMMATNMRLRGKITAEFMHLRRL
jgi:hypothetical protein